MEGGTQENEIKLRDEGDVQGSHYHEKEYQICYERTIDSHTAAQSLHCQYVLRFPR